MFCGEKATLFSPLHSRNMKSRLPRLGIFCVFTAAVYKDLQSALQSSTNNSIWVINITKNVHSLNEGILKQLSRFSLSAKIWHFCSGGCNISFEHHNTRLRHSTTWTIRETWVVDKQSKWDHRNKWLPQDRWSSCKILTCKCAFWHNIRTHGRVHSIICELQ